MMTIRKSRPSVMTIARPDARIRLRLRGRSEARRTSVKLLAGTGQQAAATRVRRRSNVARRERGPGRHVSLERIVLAVRARPHGGIEHPTAGLTGRERGERAAAVGEQEEIVEVVVDVLRLPLPVDRPDALRDRLVVAV